MPKVGYARLVELLNLRVVPPAQPACIDTSVNRRVDAGDRILFPGSVALNDTPLGHVEFALRHENFNLPILASALRNIPPETIVARLRENPNGEYIRKAAFLWEWLHGDSLNAETAPSGRYVDLLDPDHYAVAATPTRHRATRITNNLLGTPAFCPTVRRDACRPPGWLEALMARADDLARNTRQEGLYDRAIHYLYLSETQSSFAIERERPTANKEERFVQILQQAGEHPRLTEEYLAGIQNAVVRSDFAKEAAYRVDQNWLEDRLGRITFLPHPVDRLRESMEGWEAFVNNNAQAVDPLVKIACGAFGFVYLHPFMDGNGRLHRFAIHHLLIQPGMAPADLVVPVSAVITKNIPEYLDLLNGFSGPATRLWEYARGDEDPLIESAPGPEVYRYFDATREVAFLAEMIEQAVEYEIPQELAYLRGYDQAFDTIDARYDLPSKDIGKLIRMIQGNGGELAKRKRPQFETLPDQVVHEIEAIVRESFAREAGAEEVDDDPLGQDAAPGASGPSI